MKLAAFNELCTEAYPPQAFFDYPDIEGLAKRFISFEDVPEGVSITHIELCLTCFSKTDFKVEAVCDTSDEQYWVELPECYGKELYEKLPHMSRNAVLLVIQKKRMGKQIFPKDVRGAVWTFFVLDFDGTYDSFCEDDDVFPECYLVPEKELVRVESIAVSAGKTYAEIDSDEFHVKDIFEIMLNGSEIPWQNVGTIEVPFTDRQVSYLSSYISREVV